MSAVVIEGLAEFMERLRAGVAGPVRRFLESAAIAVQSAARERAPVDTGRLRADIGYELDESSPPLWAKVGPNVFYGPYMEYGTGTLADGAGGKGGAHRPPSSALAGWAQRHGGLNPFLVARAIGARGGLRPRRYMRGGLAAALGAIEAFKERLGQEIVALLAGGGSE